MKTKTKRKISSHTKKLKRGIRAAFKGTLKVSKQTAKAKHQVAKLSKRRLRSKKAARPLLRAFFILIAAVSTGSLAFTINHTKPTAQIEIRTNIARAVEQLNPGPYERLPDQIGIASWYALGLPQPDALTCASTRFPRGTYLLVTSQRNGQSVICLVNDYGPQPWTNRVIDLSRGSFRVIEDLSRGTVPVEIRVVPPPPQSLKLPFPTNFHASIGYAKCRDLFTVQFCNDNRTQDRRLK